MGEQNEKQKVSILKIEKEKLTLTKPEDDIVNKVWNAWDKGIIDEEIKMSIPQWEDSDYIMKDVDIRNINGINFTNFRIGDEIIDSEIDKFKENESESNLVHAVVLLDAIYHTRLDDPIQTAITIYESNILKGGLKNVTEKNTNKIINSIACINVSKANGEKKNGSYIYSFATKLCNRFRPDLFPIFDRFVAGLLSVYMNVPRSSMGNYKKFCKTYKQLIDNYELRSDDGKIFKKIDTFMWTYGRVLANKESGVVFDSISYIPQ